MKEGKTRDPGVVPSDYEFALLACPESAEDSILIDITEGLLVNFKELGEELGEGLFGLLYFDDFV